MPQSPCSRGRVAFLCLSLACTLLLLSGGGGGGGGATSGTSTLPADTTRVLRIPSHAATSEGEKERGSVHAVLRTHPGSGFQFFAHWIATRCLCRVMYSSVSSASVDGASRNETKADEQHSRDTAICREQALLLLGASCTLEVQIVPVTKDVVAHAAGSTGNSSLSDALMVVGDSLCARRCTPPTATFVRSSVAATCAAVQADRMATMHQRSAWASANAASSACHSSTSGGSTISMTTANTEAARSVKLPPELPTSVAAAAVTRLDFESTITTDVHEQKRLLLRLLRQLFPTSRSVTEAERKLNNGEESSSALACLIDEDAHLFRSANRWWDSSEGLLSPALSTDASRRYLAANRQCARQGIFPHRRDRELSEERNSAASISSFDERFSGLHTFQDREALYAAPTTPDSPSRPIHCGFQADSVWERIRERFRQRSECEWVIFTVIIDCYDPLPIIQSEIPPKTCFVAFLDNRTYGAIGRTMTDRSFVLKRKRGHKLTRPPWEVINLGNLSVASPFRWSVKTVEVIKLAAVRLFPLARRVFWLDGKAVLYHISRVIRLAHGSVLLGMRSYFHDPRSKYGGKFDLAKEFLETRIHLAKRYGGNHTPTYRLIAREIDSQETQYRAEGWFERIMEKKLRATSLDMIDIAAMSYAPTDPCAIRLTCAWMNEVSFYNYRGQLSLHYVLHRLSLIEWVRIDANFYLQAYFHHKVCDDQDRPITLVN